MERKQNELCCSVLEGKEDTKNKRKRCCKARQTSKHIIATNNARNRIHLINIYVDYSYNFGVMTQGHNLHLRHNDVNKRENLDRNPENVPASVFLSLIW